ncbi:MAG: substrate-binding domain-containing protein [Planctomycetaceae bacterium]
MKPEFLDHLLTRNTLPKMFDLAVVVRVYRLLESGVSLKSAYSAFPEGISSGKIRKAVLDVEAATGIRLWVSWSGKTVEIDRSQQAVDVIKHFEQLLENYAHVSSLAPVTTTPGRGKSRVTRIPIPTIRIGTEPELARWILPEAIRRCRHNYQGLDFEVLIETESPQKLRRRGLVDGEFDVVAVSADKDELKLRAAELIGPHGSIRIVNLTPHVLVDRRHRLAQQASVDWSDLEDMVLILPKGISPSPEVPYEKLPPGVHLVRSTSYSDAHAMTLAAGGRGNVCCLSFPQVLTPQRRGRFTQLLMPDLHWVQHGVFLPQRASERQSHRHQDVAMAIADELYGYLLQQTQSFLTVDLLKGPSHQLWHVSRQAQGKLEWTEGRLFAISMAGDGYFRADHETTVDNRQLKFSISGRLAQTPHQELQLAWRGWDTRSEGIEEVYVASFFIPQHRERPAGVVGYWMGRATNAPVGLPDLGYMVLLPPEAQKPTKKDLRKLVDAYESLIDESGKHGLERLKPGTP